MKESAEAKYKKISTKTLANGDMLTFDVYNLFFYGQEEAQMANKLANKYQSLKQKDFDAITSLKDVYILRDEVLDYCLFIGSKLFHIVTDDKLTDQMKARIIYSQAILVLENIFSSHNTVLTKELWTIAKAINIMFLINKDILKQFLIVASKKYSTVSHSVNVGIYAAALGSLINVKGKDLESLIVAGLLHDIGKVDVDDAILYKATELTKEEFDEVKKHSINGKNLAKKLGIDDEIVLVCIKDHHERLDGTGYPIGIKGDKISFHARIIAVCDVFDALSTERTYRRNFNTFESILTMGKKFVNHLDPVIVKTFIKMMGNKANAK